MASNGTKDAGAKSSRPRKGANVSQDQERTREDARHHPESHSRPHTAHHPQKKPVGETRHHPHTPPEEQDLNIDHGTHEDRPRPGKLAKESVHYKA